MATVTEARLANLIKTLILKFKDLSIYLWTDSQIVLHWIHHLKPLTQSQQFVADCVQEIRNSFSTTYWTYVLDNPADLFTRHLST